MKGALLGLLLACPASAAAPYAEDAAAVAAFFASSVTFGSSAVSVQEVEAPAPTSTAATHALRAELLRLGVAVVRPDAPSDYDLRGAFVTEPGGTVWLSSLWRKADGRLAAAYDRTLGASASPPPAAGKSAGAASTARRRLWGASAGTHFRTEAIGWMAGVHWACPTGRWEAGLDVGNYGSDKTSSILNVITVNRTEVWHARLRGTRLVPVADISFFDGWLPSSTVLRAGLGASLLQLKEKVIIRGVGPQAFTREHNDTVYLRPLFELGARFKLTRIVALDLGVEWIPDLYGPGYVNRGGFGGAARVRF